MVPSDCGARTPAEKHRAVETPARVGAQAPEQEVPAPQATVAAEEGGETDEGRTTLMQHKQIAGKQLVVDIDLADQRIQKEVASGKRKAVDITSPRPPKMPSQKIARLNDERFYAVVESTVQQSIQDAADQAKRVQQYAETVAAEERARVAEEAYARGPAYGSPVRTPRVIPPRVSTLRESTQSQAHARNASLAGKDRSPLEEGEEEDESCLVDYEGSDDDNSVKYLGYSAPGTSLGVATRSVASKMDDDEEKPSNPTQVVEIHNCDVAEEARIEAEEAAYDAEIAARRQAEADRFRVVPRAAIVSPAAAMGARARAAGASVKLADVPQVPTPAPTPVAETHTTVNRRGRFANRTFAEDLAHVVATYGEADPPTAVQRVGIDPQLQMYESTVEREWDERIRATRLYAQGRPLARIPNAPIPIAYGSPSEDLLGYMDEFMGWAESGTRGKIVPNELPIGSLRSKLIQFARTKTEAWANKHPQLLQAMKAARGGGTAPPTSTAAARSRSTRGGDRGRLPSGVPPAPTSRARASTPSSGPGTQPPGRGVVAAEAALLPNIGVVACSAAQSSAPSFSQLEGPPVDPANPTRCECERTSSVPCLACVRAWRNRTEHSMRQIDARVTRHRRDRDARQSSVDRALALAEQERTSLRVTIDRLEADLQTERDRHDATAAELRAALQEERDQCNRLRGHLEALQRQVDGLQSRPAITQMMHSAGPSQALNFPSALLVPQSSAAAGDSPPQAHVPARTECSQPPATQRNA